MKLMEAFFYNVVVARRRFILHPFYTCGLSLMLGLGIGSTLLMLETMHFLSGDALFSSVSSPLGSFVVHRASKNTSSDNDHDNLVSYEAYRFLADKSTSLLAVAVDMQAAITTEASRDDAEYPIGLTASRDTFQLFGLKFLSGRPWSQQESKDHARVVVVSQSLADKMHLGPNAIGHSIRIDENAFRVVGVVKDWQLLPHFYNAQAWTYSSKSESYLLPIDTARDMNFLILGSRCTSSAKDCNYLSVWTSCQLQSCTQDARVLKGYLRDAANQTDVDVEVLPLPAWLVRMHLVPGIARAGLGGAILFFAVCLFSVAGILLARHQERGLEIGLHRALGAPAKAIFAQCLIEAFMYVALGSILGLILARLGLLVFQRQPTDYAPFVTFNTSQFVFMSLLAGVATAIIGLAPAWIASRVSPSELLRGK